ncbi:MAG: elements of external origin [Hyphomicrobiales bacterium]|nr:elements of external origin [Hyphomicrobiales bacterium]
MGLSRRAYAKHRKLTENAVRKAIAAGRIELEPDGTIDPVKADLAWDKRTDPAQQREAKPGSSPAARAEAPAEKVKPVPFAAVEAVRDTLREAGEPPSAGGMNYVTARTANEVIKAQERRLRLGKLKGELVDRVKATTTVFMLARRERDAWVQWPARVAALIAAELGVDAHLMEATLDRHVRQHLAELSDIRVELR